MKVAAEDAPNIDVLMLEGRPPVLARQEVAKLGTRCKIGCYVCGKTVSSRFRRWRHSKVASRIEKIKAQQPESEEICAQCLLHYLKEFGTTEYQEVHSSQTHELVGLDCVYVLCVDESGGI